VRERGQKRERTREREDKRERGWEREGHNLMYEEGKESIIYEHRMFVSCGVYGSGMLECSGAEQNRTISSYCIVKDSEKQTLWGLGGSLLLVEVVSLLQYQ